MVLDGASDGMLTFSEPSLGNVPGTFHEPRTLEDVLVSHPYEPCIPYLRRDECVLSARSVHVACQLDRFEAPGWPILRVYNI